MPGAGLGGLISNLINPGLDDQIGAAITPNPNPLAQQGQPPATSGSPTLPNAAATKMDPYVGNLAAMLLKRQHQAELAADLNNNIAGMAAGFGTAQQQASKQAALGGRGGGIGGGIGDVGDIMKIQQGVTDQNEHARFMANMDVLAKILFPGDPNGVAKATEVANNSGMLTQFGQTAASNATQTGETKNVNEYGTLYAKQKGYDSDPSKWTPEQAQDVASAQANSMAGAMGGNDLNTRQYLSAVSSGAFKGTLADWNSQNVASATVQKTQAEDSTAFKDQAIQDVEKVNTKLSDSEAVVDRLLKSIPDTMTALGTPDFLTSGKGIAQAKKLPVVGDLIKNYVAPSDTITALAADARTLISGLSASALSEFKNVRNRQEFNAIGQSLTAALDAANSPEAVRIALEQAKHSIAVARINAKAAAGRELSPEEAPLANPEYLKPMLDNGQKNPYFTGATVAKSAAPTQAAPTASAPAPKRRHYNEKGELVDQ